MAYTPRYGYVEPAPVCTLDDPFVGKQDFGTIDYQEGNLEAMDWREAFPQLAIAWDSLRDRLTRNRQARKTGVAGTRFALGEF